ncbi:homoserine kinase [Chitinophaga polysaccharea]|uniref:homoserine kinase n=1 Tax=Chitinophaga TaxID=79328 RepID=UPI001455BC72|nr:MULTISPECIES: homoserine kinase [Chitinophaga]NLR58523.1 homoserine kinase [Chitinophaga polysaccharea]NLU91051.1 homoserine kinase [Chitinophaga sp. Ak27]
MDSIKVFAPGTVANVACGFDVIGLALDAPGDEMILRRSSEPGIRITAIHGADLPLEASRNVAGVAVQALLQKYERPDIGIEIEIFKKIHPGSGIGSSAASSAGAVVGVNHLLGEPFTKKQLVRFAMEGERLACGSAHADNVAPAILGGFTLVRSYRPLDITGLRTPEHLWVTVIHPQIEVKTSDAREILKQKVLMTDAIRQWGNVAALVAGLYQDDYELISRSLEDVIVEPVRAILIPAFHELKLKCKEAGALGGGISGSGPSVFMLSKGEENARKVAATMDSVYAPLGVDYKIYVSQINTAGVKVID